MGLPQNPLLYHLLFGHVFFWRLLRIQHPPPKNGVWFRGATSQSFLGYVVFIGTCVCVCGPGLGSKAKICALELVRCLGIIWNLGLAFLDCFARKIKQSPNVDVVIVKHRVANFLNITAPKKNKIHCPRFCSSLTCRVHKEKAFCVVLYCSGYWDHLFVSLSWAIVPKPSLFYFTAQSLRKHCFGFRHFSCRYNKTLRPYIRAYINAQSHPKKKQY